MYSVTETQMITDNFFSLNILNFEYFNFNLNLELTGLSSVTILPYGDFKTRSTTSHTKSSRLLSRSSNVINGHSASICVYLQNIQIYNVTTTDKTWWQKYNYLTSITISWYWKTIWGLELMGQNIINVFEYDYLQSWLHKIWNMFAFHSIFSE